MSDQPLTLAVFEKFQREVFEEFQREVLHQFQAIGTQFGAVARRFDAMDRRFESLEAKVDARFDEVTGQIDGLTHRLLRLEQESVLVNAALKRLETGAEGVKGQLSVLDRRLRRIGKGLDRLVAAKPKYALRTDVQDMRGRVADLKARLGALEKRRD